MLGRKIAWVNWEEVCRPREHGGLGIKNIVLFNVPLRKWRWRMMTEKESLGCLILKSKYGDMYACMMSCKRISNSNSIWWRDLVEVCEERQVDAWFDKNIEWKLGDGRRLSF